MAGARTNARCRCKQPSSCCSHRHFVSLSSTLRGDPVSLALMSAIRRQRKQGDIRPRPKADARQKRKTPPKRGVYAQGVLCYPNLQLW